MARVGSYRGAEITPKTARVQISSSADADLAVTEALDVRVSGSGSVAYSGDPKVTQQITGSGKLTKNLP